VITRSVPTPESGRGSEGVEIEDAHVQGGAPLQGSAQRPVQTVLEVDLAVPVDGVREQVAVERRVLVQEMIEFQAPLRGGELVEANRAWRDVGPVACRQPVIRVRAPVPHGFENHS
jgi:hypothetical protein